MNNNILPCSGLYLEHVFCSVHKVCQKRDTCLRYQQWLKNNALGREIWSHVNARPCIKENYKLYLEGKK